MDATGKLALARRRVRVVSWSFGFCAPPPRGRRRRHDLSGERALAGDHHELPVAAAAARTGLKVIVEPC